MGTFTRQITFSPDDTEFLIAGASGIAYRYDLKGNILQSFIGDIENKFTAVAYSPDKKFIYLGTENGTLSKWSKDGQLINEFVAHQNAISTIIFSQDSKKILTSGFDGIAKLWDTKGNYKKTLSGNTNSCLLYTSPSPRDATLSRMPSSA